MKGIVGDREVLPLKSQPCVFTSLPPHFLLNLVPAVLQEKEKKQIYHFYFIAGI